MENLNPRHPRVSVYIASSLDGFIATPEGGLSWLDSVSSPDGEDYGYARFMAGVDAVLMGRKTYDVVRAFPEWPFDGKKVFVLTHRPIQAIRNERFVSGPLAPVLASLAQEGLRHVYLDGGTVVQAGLREGVVDELTVSLIPILLGSGIPLFGELRKEVRLQLTSSQSYPTGLVQVRYRIGRD